MKSKLLAIIILLSILLFGCGDVHVSVRNTTLDNFRINEGGTHLKPGQTRYVFLLNEDFPTDGFDICRSYGCLARVTVTATEFPKGRESDTITITESPRDTFNGWGGDYTTVTIKHAWEN